MFQVAVQSRRPAYNGAAARANRSFRGEFCDDPLLPDTIADIRGNLEKVSAKATATRPFPP